MNGLVVRLLAVVLPVIAGFAIGRALSAAPAAPWLGALVGGALAFATLGVRDTVRAVRFVDWLRGAPDRDAPRAHGLWGELGYRVERALRSREQALQAERERLTQFLSGIEASPNGVMMLDAGDRIDWCNAVAADHFGLDPVRDRLQQVTNLIRAPAFVAHLQHDATDEAVELPDPTGRRVISALVRPYGDGQRLVLSRDVTERERAEAMRREFVANVSHEIRTPLTVLTGFVDTMRRLPLEEAERQRMLALMAQQAERMATLVNDLLTLARLEGSPWPDPERWVPLGPLLARIAAEARELSGGRHTLVFPPEASAQWAGASEELLSAIANLVQNAIRYTPAGGRIEVGWRVLPDGAGEIAVVDDGPGIAREHLPRLTERFYRVDQSRSRESGGTGLGLAIVKHVMQRHGGELQIASEVGRGSTFRLTMPAARVRAAPAAGAMPTAVAAVRAGSQEAGGSAGEWLASAAERAARAPQRPSAWEAARSARGADRAAPGAGRPEAAAVDQSDGPARR